MKSRRTGQYTGRNMSSKEGCSIALDVMKDSLCTLESLGPLSAFDEATSIIQKLGKKKVFLGKRTLTM